MAKSKRRNFWPLVKAYCESRGWVVDRSERSAGGRVSYDLFGFIDAVACVPKRIESYCDLDGVTRWRFVNAAHKLAIQYTSKNNKASRLRKVRQSPHAAAWMANGDRIEVWAFDDNNELERIPVVYGDLEPTNDSSE